MKKLMIAASLVCAAALSQAATFDWGANAKSYGPDVAPGSIAAGYYEAGDSTSQYMTKFTAQANWTADITISLLDSLGEVVSSETITGTAVKFSSNKVLNDGSVSSSVFNLPATGADPLTYAIDVVLKGTMKNATTGADTFYLTSDTIHKVQTFSDLGPAQFSVAPPAGWTVEAAPEPTSGLLLLLGVASLALRRRRA